MVHFFIQIFFIKICKNLLIQHIQEVQPCELNRAPDGSLSSRYTGNTLSLCYVIGITRTRIARNIQFSDEESHIRCIRYSPK